MNLLHLSFIGLTSAAMVVAASSSDTVTFDKDVLPILQKHCQECHRPGEVAPMSLLTYTEARPWAKAIKAAVLTQKMPPWFADPKIGHYANDRHLGDADIKTLAAWADGGALEGDVKDKPAALAFTEGWGIKPDMVIEMPEDFHVPATGAINMQNILVKANFKEDTWVVAAEMRPGNSAVVHHMRGIVRPPGSDFMANAIPGKAYDTGDQGFGELGDKVMGRGEQIGDLLGKYNPGLGPQFFDVDGAAKFVPKGSDIIFNMHYTTNGKPGADRSKLALVFAKHPPSNLYITANLPRAGNMVIPAGDNNAEVVSEVTVQDQVKLVSVQPHMHIRGKDYEVRVIYPTGEMEPVFKAKWDFNWQLGYEFAQPIVLPKGTRIIGISHFDNSPNNPFNPDPKKEIYWGPQNWDEMSAGFLGFVVDSKVDLKTLFRQSGVSLLKRVPGQAGPTLALVAPGSSK